MCHILLKGRLFAQISWNGLHFSFHSKRKKREANYFKITEFHEHIHPWIVILDISILKLCYYKNALNCISTAHKSLFECMIKRNNKRQLITDYLQFRTLFSTNSSAQCHLFFLSFFHLNFSSVILKLISIVWEKALQMIHINGEF